MTMREGFSSRDSPGVLLEFVKIEKTLTKLLRAYQLAANRAILPSVAGKCHSFAALASCRGIRRVAFRYAPAMSWSPPWPYVGCAARWSGHRQSQARLQAKRKKAASTYSRNGL